MSVEDQKLFIVKNFMEYVKTLPKELPLTEYMVKQNEYLIDRLAISEEKNRQLSALIKQRDEEEYMNQKENGVF